MPKQSPRRRSRISFDRWQKAFLSELKNDSKAEAVIRRSKRQGLNVDRLMVHLWIYSCPPSKRDLQAALLGSDHEVESLCRRVLDTANQIEKLNDKASVNLFLGTVQKSGVLPSYKLDWGADLRDLPQLFKTLPEVLRQYVHTLRSGRDFVKKAVAGLPLLRGRALQILYYFVQNIDLGMGHPLNALAPVLQVAYRAAGDAETLVNGSSLLRQFDRFKAIHPEETRTAKVMAALARHDLPIKWVELLFPYLITQGPLHQLLHL